MSEDFGYFRPGFIWTLRVILMLILATWLWYWMPL